MHKRTYLLAPILILLLLSACSSDGPQSVSISMAEFEFSPSRIVVPAGAEVTVQLRNLGALEHNFHIMHPGEEISESWSDADAAGTLLSHTSISGGDSRKITFTAPDTPGEYQIVCSIPSHFELGMEATLVVTGR